MSPPSTDAPSFTELPDLAAEANGGAAILCNDEFFAEKENLLRAHDAEWREGVYTDRGKWMDGWETRRRREPGSDWCVIRLGLPGRVRGVVVDTAYFRGNYPEACAIEACEIDDPLDLAALLTARWVELVPRSPLGGDRKNYFAIAPEFAARSERATHVRLTIFPDGGVARLRVHGDVVPDRARLRRRGEIDLAALEHGGWVEACSDMFFGNRQNLIKPGPSRSMADGWETRRRRGPGNDWAIVRLAAPGIVERLEIDTTHFKGNAPGRCVVEGVWAPGASAAQLSHWRALLASPLQPHTRHRFDDELRRIGVVSHLRLSVFPDGGVARLRAWGALDADKDQALLRLNGLSDDEATAAFLRCCGARRWAGAMAATRPFEDRAALVRIGERTWWQQKEDDWLEAFAAHPRIGERTGSAWSAGEQAAAVATDSVASELAALNQRYLDRFGFVFLVCATGRGAESMLAELRARAAGDRDDELRTAAEEQAKITRLRLAKLLEELA
jgi:allantoicase